ncbi:hypothetical protein ARTSIC4J27_2435 [Pseudarthrobacter siccitolerans]|uniref:Uncharacterized protein n=1 Tax=Pseudarthrobacter siccitolerans TaxID=861266 RepID=A0A024H439_9MICC|nr:hypothetical protein ARTSIC4J27_2435 [Pseudarthrobacter siccitolerans]
MALTALSSAALIMAEHTQLSHARLGLSAAGHVHSSRSLDPARHQFGSGHWSGS